MNRGPKSKSCARVLVVDDEIVDRTLVVRGLSPLEDVEVLEAKNALEAKKRLEREPVDVVVTDVMMPGMDGLTLIRWAKEHCPDATWIILSGLDTFAGFGVLLATTIGLALVADFLLMPALVLTLKPWGPGR